MALLATGAPPPAAQSYIGLTSVAYNAAGNCAVSAVPIGAAANDRHVFMIVHWLAGSPASALSAATIGGMAATIHVQTTGASASTAGAGSAIISAPLAAGTTADVTLTFSRGTQAYLGTHRVTGLLSATAKDTLSASPAGAANPYTGTLDAFRDGILLFGAMLGYNTPNYTITGATENYENSVDTNEKVVGSSLNVTADETSRSMTISGNGSSQLITGPIVGAAFR